MVFFISILQFLVSSHTFDYNISYTHRVGASPVILSKAKNLDPSRVVQDDVVRFRNVSYIADAKL